MSTSQMSNHIPGVTLKVLYTNLFQCLFSNIISCAVHFHETNADNITCFYHDSCDTAVSMRRGEHSAVLGSLPLTLSSGFGELDIGV